MKGKMTFDPSFPICAEVDLLAQSNGELCTSQMKQEYEDRQGLYRAQAPEVQRHLEAQGRSLADGLIQGSPRAILSLPERVCALDSTFGQGEYLTIPERSRRQMVGSRVHWLARAPLLSILQQRLDELEQSPDPGLSIGAMLVRHASVLHLVWSVYFPQWVAFDEEELLLTRPVAEAEVLVASMQRFLGILNTAVSLAPYIAADPAYQQKRNRMLGQFISLGRALACRQTDEIIATIKQRAAAGSLNRGLRLSLPYLDDQALGMKTYDFEVIPAGRIPFDPAYIMLVTQEEQKRVSQDKQLNLSTRKYLLAELKRLERSFEVPGFAKFTKRPVRRGPSIQIGIKALRLAFCALTSNSKKDNW